MTLVVGAAAWCARALMVFVPDQIGSMMNMSIYSPDHNNRLYVSDNDQLCWTPQGQSLIKTSIGRALCQVLDLVNDIPTTSRKYEFARCLADKILSDNIQHGTPALKEVNVRALEAGFSRTISMLAKCLEHMHRQEQVAAWAWPWRILNDLPYSLLFQCVPLLATLRNGFGTAMHNPLVRMIVPAAITTTFDGSSEIVAEKLANELLWMAQRLGQNSATHVAVLHWSSAADLAHWSLSSSPRVQKLLVKLSAFLCTGLVYLDRGVPAEVTLRLLLVWLPLLCRSSHTIDETTLSTSDKNEAEQMLCKAIQLLPDRYQELVLAMWLTEYTRSPSDWPNVQGCYHGWCQSTRKLYY